MAEITAAMVKELREMTGAGMMDCKKALNETNGNMEEAVEFLRKNGQAKAEKKAIKQRNHFMGIKCTIIQHARDTDADNFKILRIIYSHELIVTIKGRD